MIGIYKITNKNNGKSYIGQSRDIKQRWRQHKNEKNSSNLLYQDFKNYGIENFTFEILEECEINELNDKEKYWIAFFDTYDNGYNLTHGGQGSQRESRTIIHIKREIDKNVFMLKWEDYIAAAKELSPSALNLYMYLAKNQDNYELWFSSKDYCKTFNVVDKTYRNARNELLKKGYLKEGNNNHVYFDSKGGYKETKENLQEELKTLGERLKVEDEERYLKLKEVLKDAKLKEIREETIYKIEIKKVISFAKDLLKEISQSEFEGLF